MKKKNAAKVIGGALDTTNIVESLDEGGVIGVTSFPNTKDGNRLAAIRLFDIIKENEPDLLDEEIEKAVKKGEFSMNGYTAQLVVGET